MARGEDPNLDHIVEETCESVDSRDSAMKSHFAEAATTQPRPKKRKRRMVYRGIAQTSPLPKTPAINQQDEEAKAREQVLIEELNQVANSERRVVVISNPNLEKRGAADEEDDDNEDAHTTHKLQHILPLNLLPERAVRQQQQVTAQFNSPDRKLAVMSSRAELDV